VTLRLTWCSVHQAWSLSTHSYLEAGQSITDVAPYTEVHFGPFDSLTDVVAVAARALDAHAECVVYG
jgi:hypothetical protein